MVSKCDSKTNKEVLRNSEIYRASSSMDIKADIVGKEMHCSRVETLGMAFSAEDDN